jgi:hypothetical protein
MPRYFFFLESSTGTIPDEQGEELPDDDAAHRLALRIARELADWERVSNASVVVISEDGRLVSEVPLKPLLN